ncbi:hypothetical protein [Amycolatopsis anabasis]|uniref:hypothetical protein n=1 Tax=Amycolatopsis anabasis TaxID=1840409 RepID=UPI00131B296D|nr:hypothetical protein [Amycolatopsis anabasis]
MIRYQLALLGHSQRYLPPLLAYLGLLAVLFNERDSPAPPEFAVSAGALTVVACWLTIALVDAEDPVQRLITLAHARRVSAVLGGVVAAVLACSAGLTALVLAWSLVTHGAVPGAELGFGALAHLACAGTGIAIGLPCSRLLVARAGWTVIGALLALAVVVLARPIPLVNPMLRTLAADESMSGAVLLGAAVSALVLAASAVLVGVLVQRRS